MSDPNLTDRINAELAKVGAEPLSADEIVPQCDVDWGSATDSQRCILSAGHAGIHCDRHHHHWSTAPSRPSGLPQSEHGGLHPELRARVSNAIDALYDFRQSERYYHESDPYADVPRPDYEAWAHRLNAALQGLITAIERNA